MDFFLFHKHFIIRRFSLSAWLTYHSTLLHWLSEKISPVHIHIKALCFHTNYNFFLLQLFSFVPFVSIHISVVVAHLYLNMASLFWSLAVIFLAGSVSGHDSYLGKCPNFKPMDGFDFDRVSSFCQSPTSSQYHTSVFAYDLVCFFAVYRKVVRSWKIRYKVRICWPLVSKWLKLNSHCICQMIIVPQLITKTLTQWD